MTSCIPAVETWAVKRIVPIGGPWQTTWREMERLDLHEKPKLDGDDGPYASQMVSVLRVCPAARWSNLVYEGYLQIYVFTLSRALIRRSPSCLKVTR